MKKQTVMLIGGALLLVAVSAGAIFYLDKQDQAEKKTINDKPVLRSPIYAPTGPNQEAISFAQKVLNNEYKLTSWVELKEAEGTQGQVLERRFTVKGKLFLLRYTKRGDVSWTAVIAPDVILEGNLNAIIKLAEKYFVVPSVSADQWKETTIDSNKKIYQLAMNSQEAAETRTAYVIRGADGRYNVLVGACLKTSQAGSLPANCLTE